MSSATIDQLIINSPYTAPSRHWRYERKCCTFIGAWCANTARIS